MNNITVSYKKAFIEAVILANKELFDYINNNLSLNDFEYTNITGFGGDNSLKIDLLAENIFIKHLEKFGNIYSEECGFKNQNKDFTIIIDPLDGSNNFYSKLPYYGTSIALKKDEEIVAGFVTNLAVGTIIYRAFEDEVKYFSLLKMKNFCSFFNEESKIAVFERAYEYPDICKKLNENKIKFRCLGAVALSLSDALNYDFVLYLGNIREFDIEAALYICKDLYICRSKYSLIISKSEEKYTLIKEIINQF